MELPKNVTQVGEVNNRYRLYVEDYVISYLKQQNRDNDGREIVVALFGVQKIENDIVFTFIYGACKTDVYIGIDRRINAADRAAMERLGTRFFPGWNLVGFKNIDGEPIEDFNILENNRTYLIKGFIQFYEKNEDMLCYMLENSKHESTEYIREDYRPKTVTTPIKENTIEKKKSHSGIKVAMLATAVVAYFALSRAINNGGLEVLQTLGKNVNSELVDSIKENAMDKINDFEGKLLNQISPNDEKNLNEPEDTNATPDTTVQTDEEDELVIMGTDKLIIDDELVEVIKEENKVVKNDEETLPEEDSSQMPSEQPTEQPTEQPSETNDIDLSDEPDQNSSGENELAEVEPIQEEEKTYQTYSIKRGESLSAICVKNYGNLSKMKEICELNNISNPDNIVEGQKILLP